MCQTVVSTSVTGGSTLANGTVAALLTTVGGYPQNAGPAPSITAGNSLTPQYFSRAPSRSGGGGRVLPMGPRPAAAIPVDDWATGTIAAGTGIITTAASSSACLSRLWQALAQVSFLLATG